MTENRQPRFRIFNPHRLTNQEIRDTFVARQALFDAIARDILAHTAQGVPQHHLVVGQRGMGKTTLLKRIAVELADAPHRQNFLPLTFPEEQYIEVDRLSKFWLNCLDSAADALERENNMAAVQSIDRTVRDLEKCTADETTYAEDCFAAFRKLWKDLKRRPVLLIDNFNLLLSRLKDSDYILRGHFSKKGAPILIAASTIYPKQTEDYGAAFYDGFKPHVLNPLSLDEMQDIFYRLSHLIKKPGLESRIRRETPRLATLRDLTGGNPRTAVLLFELFVDGFSEDAYEDLDALLDIVTPLYQSRLEQLSEQAQTVVGTLARNWAPMTRADIVNTARLASSSVPAQLGRLRDIGLVEETAVFPSKKTGYQIAERFFNIWYLMRFTTRRQRSSLSSLARFLEEYHTPAERLNSARNLMSRKSLTRGNINYALALAQSLGDVPEAVELERRAELALIEQMQGVRSAIAEVLDPDEISDKVYEFAELKKKLADAVPKNAAVSPVEFIELVLRSPSMIPGGDIDELKVNRSAIAESSISASDIERIASELNRERKLLVGEIGKDATDWLGDRLSSGAIDSWKNIEQLCGLARAASKPAEHKLIIRCAGKKTIGQLPDYEFELVTEAFRPNAKAPETDWFDWGYDLHENYARNLEAEAAYREFIRTNPASMRAWHNLGCVLSDLARYEEAETAYREAIRIKPENSFPCHGLGNLLQDHLSRYEEAEEAYREAIRIEPEDFRAWRGLGKLLQNHLSRYKEAEEAYREAIRIEPEDFRAWNGLGNLLQDHLSRFEEAETAYQKAIRIEPSNDMPRHNLAFLFRDLLCQQMKAQEQLQQLVDEASHIDTQHLHKALFASYERNWNLAANELRLAIAEIDGRLPPVTRDDWFRATAVMIHLGYGGQFVALLKSEGADVTLMPFFAAVEANVVADKRHLANFPVEARSAAEEIFDHIQCRKVQLPETTRNIANQ